MDGHYFLLFVMSLHGGNGGSCHGVDLVCVIVHAALRMYTGMLEWDFLYSTSIS